MITDQCAKISGREERGTGQRRYPFNDHLLQ